MTPAILVFGHLLSFGFVAVLTARWMAMTEPRQLADLRRLDRAHSLTGLIIATGPRLLAAAAAAWAVILVLSLGEIPVTAMIHPPHRAGAGPLALTLLNDMHYQRPQTVMVASIGMMALAIGAAVVIAMIWRRNLRSAK